MNLIDIGIEKKLIRFDEDRNFVTYIHQNKKRSFNNPEEKVQLETFLTLVLIYGYPVERVKNFVTVQMGADTRQADIIVYADDECESTYIVVECKKEEVTDQEFTKAVDQAYSYAVAEGGKYVWTTSKIKNEYYEVPEKKPKSRITIPDIPQFGVKKLAPYKFVKGGLPQPDSGTVSEPEVEYGTKQKFFDLAIVSENELTRIFIQAHQSLWGGGQRKPDDAFDEFNKLIFCKLWDEKHPRKNGEPYEFQIFAEETAEDLANRIHKIYEQGKKKDTDKDVFKEDIKLKEEEIQTIVKYLQRVNLSKTDLDSKGRAFETFMGSHFRGDFGQFFTPRAIVKFIVDTLPITNDDLVLDTSCGSGGFLLYALDKVREKANELFPKYKTNADERQEHWNYWHGFAQNNLYGIELNDDIARTAKMNMIIHDDGHTNVIAADGLLSDEELREKSGNKNFRYETFDYIITNPPFGSSIKQTEKAYLGLYELGLKEVDWLDIKTVVTEKKKTRDSQSTEVLFLEQCHRFLAEGGYIAIVIPDGILSNSSLQIVRDKIEEMYRIVAVVSMPQTAFTANGAGVKSSVLFLRKHEEKNSNKISAQKLKLKEQLKTDNKFVQTIEKWQKETNEAIKKLEEAAKQKNQKASKKEIAETIKDEKAKLQTSLTDKINNLKDEMTEKYFAAKQQILDDYQIFMAIAEDIGYDATGRNTGNNELIEIGNQLSKFITHINKIEK